MIPPCDLIMRTPSIYASLVIAAIFVGSDTQGSTDKSPYSPPPPSSTAAVWQLTELRSQTGVVLRSDGVELRTFDMRSRSAAASVKGVKAIASWVTLDPNSAWAWNRSGWLESYLDRADTAIEHFERALRLSPFDPR
jgi:hypothetical protein